MVGDGPLRAAIEDYATRRNIRTVIMAGFQKQDALPQFYAIGDIFVLPSEYEPWGLVVNEAMSFGLPIMTTHGVAAAADLVGKENGVVYEPGDIDSLAAGLQRLVHHKDQREAMGKRSADLLGKLKDWMGQHNAVIMSVLCLIIGVKLIGDGLLYVQSTPDGQKALKDLYGIDGLGPASDSDYDIVRNAARVLNLDLEQQIAPPKPG